MSTSDTLSVLAKIVGRLKDKMSLTWLRVKVLYQVYGKVGKRISYVRPCFECFRYGGGWPCSCLEIVLVPGKGRDTGFSLMHEWGHVYLGDRVDLVFASTVPCEGYEESLTRLMEDVAGYGIEGLACDTVVDYVVSKHVKEYRDHIIKFIMEQVEALTTISDSNEEDVEEDALICTHLASLYVSSRALGLRDIVSKVIDCFKEFNCNIDINRLNAIVDALHGEDYLYAYEEFLNIFFEKYLKTRIQLVKTSGKDPITDKKVSYRCIKLVSTTT